MRQITSHHRGAWRYLVAHCFLLLSILAHALSPSSAPEQLSSGSAFSPWTYDLSLAPKSSSPSEQQAEVRDQDKQVASDGPSHAPSLGSAGKASIESRLARSSGAHWAASSYPPASSGAAPFQQRAPPLS
jgi:anti-sigma factor RsiW